MFSAILAELRSLRSEIAALIPTESLEEYTHPRRVRASLKRALKEYKNGRVSSTL